MGLAGKSREPTDMDDWSDPRRFCASPNGSLSMVDGDGDASFDSPPVSPRTALAIDYNDDDASF